MKTKIFKRLKNQSGQGATEYILLLVIVVGLAVMFGGKIKGIISGKISQLGSNIQKVQP